MREKLLISACLLGEPCRYDGRSKPLPPEPLERLREKFDLVPACPESLGGLPVPREPGEQRGERVYSRTGEDVTAQYRLGAARTLEIAREHGCRAALLKERSPSCGCGEVHDGTFGGGLVPGDGVTAALLKENAVKIYGESRLNALISVENAISEN